MTTRIGIDFDGVLADTQGFVVEFVREEHGVDLARAQFAWDDGRPTIEADIDVGLGGEFEAFVGDPEYVSLLDPVSGARDALWRLAEDDRFELQLATHRPPAVHDAIEAWFERNDLPGIAVPGTAPDEKMRASPPLDALVDDYHGYADAATREGALGVHLTAAWNSGDPTHPGTVTAPAWEDAVDAILDRGTA